MRISDVITQDAQARDYHKAKTLLSSILRRLSFYERRLYHRLVPGQLWPGTKAAENLTSYLAAEDYSEKLIAYYRLDIDAFKSPKPGMLSQPVKVTMENLFPGLPAPCARQKTDTEQAILDNMTQAGIENRANVARSLLAYEIAYRAHQGWYMLFNTLTLQERHIGATFEKNSVYFKNYIRNFERALPGSDRDNKDHTYFAVVEHGGKTGRLHFHVIHFFKDLPPEAKDPNFGRRLPNYWEINYFKRFWKFGWVVPKMVRYSPLDAYGKRGWRWPLDRDTGRPYEIGSPQRLATYMAKYINKSFANKKDKDQWRTRKTQNLGLPLLAELLSTFTPQELLNVATHDTMTARLNNQPIPPALLRKAALRLYRNRQNRRSSENPLPTLAAMAKNLSTRPSPLHASNVSIQTLTENNLQNIGHTRIADTANTDTFEETARKLLAAADTINAKYFSRPTGAYGSASTNDYYR